MNDKKTFKDLVNSILSPEQKETFAKAFKFETPIPVVEPVNNAAPETVPPVAGEIKTKDGTVVKYSTPTPMPNETIVMVVTPDGELPAPAGDHELENGDKITVGDAGLLLEYETAEVVAPVAPVTQEAMDAAVNDVNAKLDLANKTISALVSRFDAVEKDNTELKATLATFSKTFTDLLSTPMANPIVTPERSFSKQDKMFSKLGLNK
jgi:hypothetical protein